MPLKHSKISGQHNDFVAESALIPYGIVKPGTDKNAASRQLLQASAASDDLIGAIQSAAAMVIGDKLNNYGAGIIFLPDTGLVVLGAEVDFNEPLTSDADGKAIGAVSGDHIIGYAGQHGVADQVICYRPDPSILP